MLTSARVNRTSAPFGLQTSLFFFLSHLQSVQRLNYAKSFSARFKASALIASSPPANISCQVRPSSEMLANQSKAQTPPSNGCWKLHRGHPDGFRIQSVFPHLPFFFSFRSAENLSFSLSKPLRQHIYLLSRRNVLVFSFNGRIRARWPLRRPPCTFLTIFVPPFGKNLWPTSALGCIGLRMQL